MFTQLYPIVQNKHALVSQKQELSQVRECLAQVMMQICSVVPLQILES